MNVDKKLVEDVATTARITLSEKEKKQFQKEMQDVLEAFSKISEVDTKDLQPSMQPITVKNTMRDDQEEDCLSQEEALSQTEQKKDGYFIGPKVL